LIRRIVTGEGLHVELCALAARYIGRGMSPRALADVLHGLMLAHPPEARSDRWRNRFDSICELVASAARKYHSETAEARRQIAAAAWRAAEAGRTADEIAAVAIEKAQALGKPLALVRDVLAHIHAQTGLGHDARRCGRDPAAGRGHCGRDRVK
jgi:hypothetical protein